MGINVNTHAECLDLSNEVIFTSWCRSSCIAGEIQIQLYFTRFHQRRRSITANIDLTYEQLQGEL